MKKAAAGDTEKKEKQEKLEQEYTQRLQEKQAELARLEKKEGATYECLLLAMDKPPYKSEVQQTKDQFLKLVNKHLANVKLDATFDTFLNSLNTDQITLLMAIILKNLQLVSEGTATVNSTLLLRLYSHILETKGVSYQLRATSKKYTL